MIAVSWSKHDQRVLLVGSLILTGLVGASRGLPVMARWSADRRDAALSLVRQAALASGADRLLPVLADSLAARRARLDILDTMLISASTVAEAGARLSNVISEYADARSVRVVSLQVRPDSVERRGFTRVAVRLTGIADVAGLTALLGDVESSTPVLAVRELGVTQPDPAVPDNKPETLRFEVWVEALALIRRAG